MSKSVNYLVVDSGAFIKSAPVHEYATNILTVSGVIKEIKDKETLARLQFLPYSLKVTEPTPEAYQHVLEFSKKTGDYSNLSLVDLQILALTYQLEKENVGTEHLNTKPLCKVIGKPSFTDNQISGFYVPEKDDKDCEDAWLTHQNVSEVKEKMGELSLESPVAVACISTDFCIQNVLIQMGLNVISVDGMLIKEAQVFILRCFSCYKTTNDSTKKFCPNCGNKTLKRVSVSVHEDGSKDIHINFRRPINIRGTRYSLPLPKGGKHATDPILFEDQPIPQNRPKKRGTQKVDVMSGDYLASSSPFAVNDVFSRAANLGIRSNNTGRHNTRRNPNESLKCTGNRKK